VYALAGVTSFQMGDQPGFSVTNAYHTYTHMLKMYNTPGQ